MLPALHAHAGTMRLHASRHCRVNPTELAETVGRLTTLVKLDLPEYTLDGGEIEGWMF